ncbi:class I SAM-dependent methyltransferase [Auraticoccus monumenti]|uniref:Predicted O-methyltransferase YrrM n=1 Tax=Auraticoccus monumenti TaxID=675864 RepID=A0A1G6RIT0_9ACTN|nr:class I SAM-dependent methyltransferase [Auraticoccus monumenti]SDD03885.1 Predicted O-methyltransferase YrrM [Auraticoccus monumenti]
MRRWTRRQWVLIAASVVLWLVGIAACLLTAWPVAGAALATLVLLVALAVVDSGSEDARLLAKVNVLTKRADRTLEQVDGLEERLARQMRSARRAVEDAGTQSLDEISTFKLQLAAVIQQLVEINQASRAMNIDAIDERLSLLRDGLDEALRRSASGVVDVVERVASERGAGEGRQAKDLDALKATTRQLHSDIVATRRDVNRVSYEPAKEVEAMLQLTRRYEPKDVLPLAGGWAMSSSGILMLTEMVRDRRPALVVECGSGASTLWLGYALRAQGYGKVVALEHEESYAAQVRALVARHDLQDWVTVLHAPLQERDVEGETHRWYSADQTDGLGPIDILVVDGPPQAVGPWSRYPALPLLESRLRADAVLVIDDAARDDEKAVVQRWKERRDTVTQLPFTSRYQAVLTGVGRLQES